MREISDRITSDFSLLDRKAMLAIVYTAVAMSCVYYLKNAETLASLLKNTRFADFGEFVARSPDNNLPALAYWVTVLMLFYFVLPALGVKFLFKRSLSDYGLNFRIEKGFFRLLLQCSVVMLPLVYLMSLTDGFSAKYPFLQVYNGEPYFSSTLLLWELMYFFQFFGLEFFFRGFLVHSLKPALGAYSIFVMTVPYCMIHFGKPVAETFSAIFAGIFLGWLSYRNGNIWMGLVLHCLVAFSMDILALYNKGLLF